MAFSGALRLWGLIKTVKDDALILYYAWKHPETPAFIKSMLVVLATYVFSPIDIIPDYFPFIGIADDIAIIPAAVLFLTNLLPHSIRIECETASKKWRKRLPWFFIAFIVFLIIWLGIAIAGLGQVISLIRNS